MDEEDNNFLNLPDEEFEKFGAYPPTSPVSSEEQQQETPPEDDSEQEEQQGEEAEQQEEEEDDNSSGESSEEADAGEEEDSDQAKAEGAGEESESDESSAADDEQDEADADPAKTFYEALTAPIKANGREIKIESAEEAIKLIQMGAGFTRKIAELKPARQLFKTLEQHKMLDEQSIAFAIDLVNGNKDAILKLMRDKGINPLELDTSSESEYKSQVRLAPEQSIEFDDVIDTIKDSEHYEATVKTVKGWDRASQTAVAQDPRLIQQLNIQMENGVYQKVNAEVEKLRALGDPQLTRLSDLEAYVAIGRLMAERGDLSPPSAGGKSNTNSGREVLPNAGKKSSPETQGKKKAAAVPRKKAPASTTSSDINPLAMSDDDFDKLMAKFA